VTVIAAADGNVTAKVGTTTVKTYKFAAVRSGLIGVGYNNSNSDFDNYCVNASGLADDWFEMAGDQGEMLPDGFTLAQNHPNPFNPVTTIDMTLPVASDWTISIYNVGGQRVDQMSGFAEAGTVSVTWDASRFASGIYFYRAQAGVYSATRKMVLLK